MANFFGLAAVGWYVKPILGLVCDSVPLFRTRWRYYLAGSSVLAAAAWLAMGWVPHSLSPLVIAAVFMGFMLATGSTIAGAILVEAGQRLSGAGRLVSLRNVVEGSCSLLAGPLGGWLAGMPFDAATWWIAAMAVCVAPVAWFGLREPSAPAYDPSVLRRALGELKTIFLSRDMVVTNLFVLAITIPPGFSPTVLYYYQTDILNLSSAQIGTLGIAGGAGSVVAAIAYGLLTRALSLRTLLLVGVAASALGNFGYLAYRSFPAALVIEGAVGFLGTLAIMAVMQLTIWATPRSAAALGFALVMGVYNLANYLADVTGATLATHFGVAFLDLVWIKAIATLVLTGTVWLLPRALLNHQDGVAAGEVDRA
jgi:Na+/melibiose symporter-like transporter